MIFHHIQDNFAALGLRYFRQANGDIYHSALPGTRKTMDSFLTDRFETRLIPWTAIDQGATFR